MDWTTEASAGPDHPYPLQDAEGAIENLEINPMGDRLVATRGPTNSPVQGLEVASTPP